jgi:hypothetical protein
MPYDVNNPPANNPYGVGYVVEKTPIKTAGFADAKPEANRVFKIINPNKLNAISGALLELRSARLIHFRPSCGLQAYSPSISAHARAQGFRRVRSGRVRGPPHLGDAAQRRRAFLR